jgi:hypothetical protein
MTMAMATLTVPTPLVSMPAGEKAAGATAKPDIRDKQADILKALQNLTADQLTQGIILSEVLGRPVSQRKNHRHR